MTQESLMLYFNVNLYLKHATLQSYQQHSKAILEYNLLVEKHYLHYFSIFLQLSHP